jgi:hypothetical protein
LSGLASRIVSILLMASAIRPAVSKANEYYVSPAGRPQGGGSIDDPWDLRTALAQPKSVRPGDIIWLRQGIYRGAFESSLAGQPNRPIIVRARPGERVTIDTGNESSGAGILVRGSDSWYWGIEVMSSAHGRVSLEKGSNPADLKRVPGIVAFGARTKFINIVIHDTAGGYDFWTPAEDSEIYGSLIYYNGWSAPDRGHGHAVYSQNQTGKKLIQDNIAFSNFGMGIRAYGSGKAFANNIDFIGNVSFNAGVLYGSPPARWENFFVTVGHGARDIVFDSNYSYQLPSANQGGSGLGWVFSETEKNVIARGNYWIGGGPAIAVWNWDDVTFERNVAYSDHDLVVLLNHLPEQNRSAYHWDRNTYYGSDLMRLNGKNGRWREWQKVTGLDAHSVHQDGRPTGTWAFLRPNKYEPERVNLIIYNWDLRDQVTVDLSSVLAKGTNFEIRDAQNFYQDEPVAKGFYQGGSVTVPMKGLTVATPIDWPAPMHTAPEFAVFVIFRIPGQGASHPPFKAISDKHVSAAWDGGRVQGVE